MLMPITVRAMWDKDVPGVTAVVTDCYKFLAHREGFTTEQLSRLIAERCSEDAIRATYENRRCFVAEVDNIVVGIATVNRSKIEEFFVLPQHHRQGIGAALFTKVEQVVGTQGHKELTVNTTGSAIPFYKTMGMQVVGEKVVSFGPLVGWRSTVLKKALTGCKED